MWIWGERVARFLSLFISMRNVPCCGVDFPPKALRTMLFCRMWYLVSIVISLRVTVHDSVLSLGCQQLCLIILLEQIYIQARFTYFTNVIFSWLCFRALQNHKHPITWQLHKRDFSKSDCGLGFSGHMGWWEDFRTCWSPGIRELIQNGVGEVRGERPDWCKLIGCLE